MKKILISLLTVLCVLLGTMPVAADSYNGGVSARIPVYMFYSSAGNDYFMTASLEECVIIQKDYNKGKSTYAYQGIVGYAIPDLKSYGLKTSDYYTDAVPVYRFFNQVTQDHFYTTSQSEKEATEKAYKEKRDNYQYEGIAFYVPENSGRPVYRFFDTRKMCHFWTMDDSTASSMRRQYQDGTSSFRYEGIGWNWYDRNA